MVVKKIETLAEFKDCIANNRLVVVDFFATWCGPCVEISPKFEEMAADNEDVQFVKVDVDKNGETAENCGIECMPTFKFFEDGEEVSIMTGANVEGLKENIRKLKEGKLKGTKQ